MMEVSEPNRTRTVDWKPAEQTPPEDRAEATGEDRDVLEVFMAYEDLSTGLRSKAALSRVFRQLETEVKSHLELCRFDMLRDPDMHYWAAREARRCHMVVVSAHGAGELPNEVVDWIHLWADQRRSEGGALVVSLDEKVRQETEANGTLACLRKVAAETGLLLLCHFGSTPRRTWE